MADPFADALAVLHSGPCGQPAAYIAAGGLVPPVPIDVVRDQHDDEASYGQSRLVQATNAFQVRRADVAEPAVGDVISIADGNFRINGAPTLDVEGLTWNCPAEPA